MTLKSSVPYLTSNYKQSCDNKPTFENYNLCGLSCGGFSF